MSSLVATCSSYVYLFLRKNPLFLFIAKSLDGTSSLIYYKNTTAIPIPKGKGTLQPSKKNWLGGKLSSSFVSDIISISMFPFTWWARKSNLFLIELIFRWPTTILFKFLIRRYFRYALVIWSTISLSIWDFSFKVEEVEETTVNICFFISFGKLIIVVSDKI